VSVGRDGHASGEPVRRTDLGNPEILHRRAMHDPRYNAIRHATRVYGFELEPGRASLTKP
jgi:hypothetical protein